MRRFFPRGSQDGRTSACRFRVRENARRRLLFLRFFRLGGAAERKKTATEKFFSYRGKNADTASENTWHRTTDLPKRISEMKQKISDEILRKSYGKNIQKHNKE